VCIKGLIQKGNNTMRLIAIIITFLCFSANAETILVKNARIFNGVDAKLVAGHVLVRDGLIESVSKELPVVDKGTVIIDANNRVLTPGFIDIHSHLSFQAPFKYVTYHPIISGAYAGKAAESYLLQGFTSVRDAGGTSPDFAKVIADGGILGPRVFSSSAYISQTSGHGDFRLSHETNPILTSRSPYIGANDSILADGVAQVLTATRENLKMGATQIKIMGGGGVTSEFDPIHTIQYTPEEIQAAVQAASDWGTYVMAHAYTSESVTRLIENGVRSIEHALLIDDKTAKLAARKNVVISTQVFIFSPDTAMQAGSTQEMIEKNLFVKTGQKNLIRLIKKYDIKTGFGTDMFAGEYTLLGEEFVARSKFWTPFEILRQSTSESAEIIRMAGPLIKSPKFGEIRPGWAADLLLINGEPHKDISILKNLKDVIGLVMKEGKIITNQLE
jgi:imidazolonepropionase-like amidohydrolase